MSSHAVIPSLRVLLVDDGAHRVAAMREELVRLGYEVVGVVDSAPLIHDVVATLSPDVVIVDSESPSRDTLEHLAAMSAASPRPVVMFTEDSSQGPMRRALHAGVSAYVVAGMQVERLAPLLNVAIARFEQERALRAELQETRGKLAERKRIERAKGILMAQRNLSDDDAYGQMRKLAMNRGLRLVDVADKIIEAHDLIG
jgi:response regulator NasT